MLNDKSFSKGMFGFFLVLACHIDGCLQLVRLASHDLVALTSIKFCVRFRCVQSYNKVILAVIRNDLASIECVVKRFVVWPAVIHAAIVSEELLLRYLQLLVTYAHTFLENYKVVFRDDYSAIIRQALSSCSTTTTTTTTC